MDSRSESDGHEDNDENAMPLLHGAGDGSNGSAGRPGLEGANSDVEDLPTQGGLPLDLSSRLETQGIGQIWCTQYLTCCNKFVCNAKRVAHRVQNCNQLVANVTKLTKFY